MTQEVTLADLQAQLADDEQAVEQAKSDLETAQTALEKGRKEPIERLLELSKAVTAAQNALSGEEKAAARTASRIQNFAFEAKKGVREQHKANLEDSIEGQVNWDALIDAGVESARVDIDCESHTVAVRFSGPGIRSTRTPSANGRTGTKVYTYNGQGYTSREFIAQFGEGHFTGKYTVEDILSGADKVGISHRADQLAARLGATIS